MVNRMQTLSRKFIEHEWSEVTFFAIFIIFMGIGLPLFVGFGLGGFSESFVAGRPLQFGDFLTSFIIYYIMMISALGLLIFKMREIVITRKGEHPANQSSPKHFAVGILHDPEQDGALYNLFDSIGLKDKKNPMRWSLSILRNFIIAILIFGALGLIQVSTGFQFVDVPQTTLISQQITKTNTVLFSTEPPATSETFTILFLFCLLLGELAWLTSKLKSLKAGKSIYYIIGLFIVSPIVGGAWAGFHSIVYGNNEAALLATFIFGTVGTFITLLTGTVIYFYVWHFANNFFVTLAQVATRTDDMFFFSGIFLGGLAIFWISSEILLWRYRKKKAYIPPTPD